MFHSLDHTSRAAGNKCIDAFAGTKDFVEQHPRGRVWDVKLSIHADKSLDETVHRRRLSAPTQNEVAILMPDDVAARDERQVVINYRTPPSGPSGLQTIPDYHRM